jgi:DNA anti-recombination protein RmuC
MKIITKIVMLSLVLGWFASTSLAQTDSPPMVDPFCLDDDPAICEKRAAKKKANTREIRQRCAEDPEWCQEWRTNRQRLHAERRALKKQCKENPEQCDELTRQLKEKQAQRRQEKREQKKEAKQKLKEARVLWCTENPKICKQWKAEKKALQEKCREKHLQLLEKYPDVPR